MQASVLRGVQRESAVHAIRKGGPIIRLECTTTIDLTGNSFKCPSALSIFFFPPQNTIRKLLSQTSHSIIASKPHKTEALQKRKYRTKKTVLALKAERSTLQT